MPAPKRRFWGFKKQALRLAIWVPMLFGIGAVDDYGYALIEWRYWAILVPSLLISSGALDWFEKIVRRHALEDARSGATD